MEGGVLGEFGSKNGNLQSGKNGQIIQVEKPAFLTEKGHF